MHTLHRWVQGDAFRRAGGRLICIVYLFFEKLCVCYVQDSVFSIWGHTHLRQTDAQTYTRTHTENPPHTRTHTEI